MTLIETNLKDCYIVDPKVYNDDRGYFFESFNQEKFNKALGQKIDFVQDNESFSFKGVLRGLHFQKGDYAQAKLVRVIKGKVLDVAVDLRKDSPSFGMYESVVLTGENKRQFFVPRGFAHGFIVLSDTAIFAYKCDNVYNKASERGIVYNDQTLNIDWQLPKNELILSDKDKVLPTFETLFK